QLKLLTIQYTDLPDMSSERIQRHSKKLLQTFGPDKSGLITQRQISLHHLAVTSNLVSAENGETSGLKNTLKRKRFWAFHLNMITKEIGQIAVRSFFVLYYSDFANLPYIDINSLYLNAPTVLHGVMNILLSLIKRCGQKRGWTMYWAFIITVDFLICCLFPLLLRKSKVRAMSEICPIHSSSLYFRVLVYSKPYYQPLHDNSILFVTNFFTVYI